MANRTYAKRGVAYWAVVTRTSEGTPVVHGSHYSAVIDCPEETINGHVFTTKEAAEAFKATLPTHYDTGREIPWEVARVAWFAYESWYEDMPE